VIHKADSLSSFIVDLSQVFTLRRVLKERSIVHVVAGRARAVRIAWAAWNLEYDFVYHAQASQIMIVTLI
jgi:hypothetical protein